MQVSSACHCPTTFIAMRIIAPDHLLVLQLYMTLLSQPSSYAQVAGIATAV